MMLFSLHPVFFSLGFQYIYTIFIQACFEKIIDVHQNAFLEKKS